MAKPSSNPVRKTATNTNRPIIPIVISLIFSPEDLHDIREKDKRLEKTADPYSVENRVDGEMTGGGNFSYFVKIHAQDNEVPADDQEQ
jgi:hypothetical protein